MEGNVQCDQRNLEIVYLCNFAIGEWTGMVEHQAQCFLDLTWDIFDLLATFLEGKTKMNLGNRMAFPVEGSVHCGQMILENIYQYSFAI